jgi:hypothetical protein
MTKYKFNKQKISILLCMFFSCLTDSFSQSKKEQIEILTNRVDSLNRVLGSERSLNQSVLNDVNSKVSKLESQIDLITSDVSILTIELQESKGDLLTKQKEIIESQRALSSKDKEIASIKKENLILLDSLALVRKTVELINKDSVFTMNKVKKENYEIKILDKDEDIWAYLSNFNLLETYSYDVQDPEMGNPYHDPSHGEDPYARLEIIESMFEKGIILLHCEIHEGSTYELYIPMLSIIEAKYLLEDLCKNMGGCTPPEEVEVEFSVFQAGVLISWGGGC